MLLRVILKMGHNVSNIVYTDYTFIYIYVIGLSTWRYS